MSLFRPLKYYFELDCIVHSYQAILNPSISIHYFIVVLRIGKAAIWLFSDQRITGPVDTFDTQFILSRNHEIIFCIKVTCMTEVVDRPI